jgi:hypothetical protein
MTDDSTGKRGRLTDEEEAQEPSSTTEGAAAAGEYDPAEGSPGVPHPTGQDFPNEAVRYDEATRPRADDQG